MSLAIDVDTVTAVLLADGWHEVRDASFSLDSYEYLWSGRSGVTVTNSDRDPLVLLGGGREALLPSTGFSFLDNSGQVIAGPLTSVLAVRVAPDED